MREAIYFFIGSILLGSSVFASVHVTDLYEVGQGDVVLTTQQTSTTNQYIYSPYGMQKNLNDLISPRPPAGEGSGEGVLLNETRKPLNLTHNQFGYTGQAQDPSTNLMMLGGFRNYAPGIGRFIQPDTYNSFSKTNITNVFAYGSGNPLFFTDPSGHDQVSEDLSIAKLAMVGLASAVIFGTGIASLFAGEAFIKTAASLITGGMGLDSVGMAAVNMDALNPSHHINNWTTGLDIAAVLTGGYDVVEMKGLKAFGRLSVFAGSALPAADMGATLYFQELHEKTPHWVQWAGDALLIGAFAGGLYSLRGEIRTIQKNAVARLRKIGWLKDDVQLPGENVPIVQSEDTDSESDSDDKQPGGGYGSFREKPSGGAHAVPDGSNPLAYQGDSLGLGDGIPSDFLPSAVTSKGTSVVSSRYPSMGGENDSKGTTLEGSLLSNSSQGASAKGSPFGTPGEEPLALPEAY